MATHSSILAWRIPWTEEPGGLQSMRLQRVGDNRAGMHAHPTFTTLLDSIINSHPVSTEQSPLKPMQCAPHLCLGVVSTLHWGKGMSPVQPCVPRAHYRAGLEPRGWRKKREKMRLREEDIVCAGLCQIPQGTWSFAKSMRWQGRFLAGRVEVKSIYMSLNQICILKTLFWLQGDKILKWRNQPESNCKNPGQRWVWDELRLRRGLWDCL